MWFYSSLAGLSLWITYSLQLVLGYVMTLCLLAFVPNARTRVRMWGCFLFLTVAAWIILWIPARVSSPLHFAFRSQALPALSELHMTLPIQSHYASYVTKFASAAWRFYLLCVGLSLLHLLVKSVQLKGLLRQTQNPSSHLELLFRRLCLQLGLQHCKLGLLSGLRSPATCYWLRSHVLLPTDLVPELESDQIANVLLHELMHVKRHDYFWDRLAALGCRLVFFHPLVWLAYRHLRWERELACDHAVVNESAEARLRYAECLTRLARWFVMRSNLSAGIGFSSSESLLATRVRVLLSNPSISSVHEKTVRAGVVAIIASVGLWLVPNLDLTLYLPFRPATLLARAPNGPSDYARTKSRSTKSAHSMSRTIIVEAPMTNPQPSIPSSVNLVLESQPASLPRLKSAVSARDSGETGYASHGDVNDARLQGSRPVWDEAPMPLASAPKWRSLVIGAITGGVGLATGRIDVEDVDGPHKKAH